MMAMKACEKNSTGIGIIRNEHEVPDNMPVRPMPEGGCIGYAEIFPEFKNKLRGLDGFSHVLLSYTLEYLGLSGPAASESLKDFKFETCTACAKIRADSIGFCKARLIRREGYILKLGEFDVLDGALLLDITPYFQKSKRKNPC